LKNVGGIDRLTEDNSTNISRAVLLSSAIYLVSWPLIKTARKRAHAAEFPAEFQFQLQTAPQTAVQNSTISQIRLDTTTPFTAFAPTGFGIRRSQRRCESRVDPPLTSLSRIHATLAGGSRCFCLGSVAATGVSCVCVASTGTAGAGKQSGFGVYQRVYARQKHA